MQGFWADTDWPGGAAVFGVCNVGVASVGLQYAVRVASRLVYRGLGRLRVAQSICLGGLVLKVSKGMLARCSLAEVFHRAIH